MIAIILFAVLHSQFLSTEARSHACIDGYCAMAACPVVSGSGRSPYCWIANGARYLTCGGNHDCTGAANGWGNCYFTSCGFDRAPDPRKEFKKTCDYKNAKMLRDLSNECSAPGYSFDSWVRAYRLTRDIYNKFNPCTGQLIEEAAKKVIKFCYCYNFCGLGQTSNGCEVNGLEGRLDLNKNLYSDYSASCRIDCTPVDKLEKVGQKTNRYSKPSKYSFSVTAGTTTTRTSSGGGSNSHSVSANVGINLKSAFSAGLGYSQTTSYDWSQSSATAFAKTITHQVSVDVQPGDTVTVYQVIGVCDNSDGNKYIIETNSLVVEGKKSKETVEV